jgi:hypothetical protein
MLGSQSPQTIPRVIETLSQLDIGINLPVNTSKGPACTWFCNNKTKKATLWSTRSVFTEDLIDEFAREGRAAKQILSLKLKKQGKQSFCKYASKFQTYLHKLKKEGVTYEAEIHIHLFKRGMD